MDNSYKGEIGDGGDTKNSEDVTVNEVLEAESSGEESALVEIETVHSEDLFAFCMDQIVNASTREERQEARDLLVDNFGETSLNEFDLDVMVNKGNQSVRASVDSEQPSTSNASQVSQSSTNTRTNSTTAQKYICKYRTNLQNDPAKYQKALQSMRDYRKQRLERMTKVENEEFRKRVRERSRKYRRNLSTVKKRERYLKKRSSASKKCMFTGCGKLFVYNNELIKHERIHLNIKPFSCTWPNCQHTSKIRSDVIQHVRTQHFKLPNTRKAQKLANIIDNRNPGDYIRVNDDLAKRRLE